MEYAPFQKVPRQRVKRDPKEGTIERGGHPRPVAPCAARAMQGLACLMPLSCMQEPHVVGSPGLSELYLPAVPI